jgi:XRE family transcriptional regulator, regulator of sulfur utilization
MVNEKTVYQTGQQIRVLRTARGLSLEDLAGLCGVHMTWLSRIETGQANPTEAQLVAIKQALNWPSDEAMTAAFALLSGETQPCEAAAK